MYHGILNKKINLIKKEVKCLCNRPSSYKDWHAGFFDVSPMKTLLKWARGEAWVCVCVPLKQECASLSVSGVGGEETQKMILYKLLDIGNLTKVTMNAIYK